MVAKASLSFDIKTETFHSSAKHTAIRQKLSSFRSNHEQRIVSHPFISNFSSIFVFSFHFLIIIISILIFLLTFLKKELFFSFLFVCLFVCSDYLFKLLLIGDSSVGKSCLLLRFAVSLISCVPFFFISMCISFVIYLF